VAGRTEDYAIIGGRPDYGANAPRRTGGPDGAAAMSGHPLSSPSTEDQASHRGRSCHGSGQ
jgi:hypothetical protein